MSIPISRRDLGMGSKGFDFLLLSVYLSLVAIGIAMIYAVGYRGEGYSAMPLGEFLFKAQAGKQIVFAAIALILMGFIMSIDWKFWRTFAYLVYGAGIVFLLLVLVFGKTINGAKAWFFIGGFGIQPVELAKLGTCLALSSFMSAPSIDLREQRTQGFIALLLGLPMFLILLQPDMGSCLVFLSFSIMLYREGMTPLPFWLGLIMMAVLIIGLKYEPNGVVFSLMILSSIFFVIFISEMKGLWIFGLAVVVGVATYLFFKGNLQGAMLTMLCLVSLFIAVHSRRGRFRVVLMTTVALLVCSAVVYGSNFAFGVLQKHQQDRINVWLKPDKADPRGVAYNSIHSKMAIGSGGWTGKGFLEGTMTQLNYVPEQSTDFIFCTVGEEHGFIGTLAVIGFYMVLLIRLVQVAERQRSYFSRCYAYGVAGIFFTHVLINVGMTMGLMPIIGIPLPFVSAGGSSLLSFTAMFAILLKLDSHRYSV